MSVIEILAFYYYAHNDVICNIIVSMSISIHSFILPIITRQNKTYVDTLINTLQYWHVFTRMCYRFTDGNEYRCLLKSKMTRLCQQIIRADKRLWSPYVIQPQYLQTAFIDVLNPKPLWLHLSKHRRYIDVLLRTSMLYTNIVYFYESYLMCLLFLKHLMFWRWFCN